MHLCRQLIKLMFDAVYLDDIDETINEPII